MPIYEYQCKKCGQFELMRKITEAPLKRCPTCQSRVTKLISNTSFQLKGTGWYVTDYARKDGKEAKRSAKESTAESKGETKPATGTATGSEKGAGPSAPKSSKSTETAAA